MNKGFTLAEILVVIAVLAILGGLILVIFINTLRGSNKSQILLSIKQNGQSVLETMDKTVRNADEVVCTSSDTLVTVKDGFYTRFKFIPPTSTTNGLIQQDSPVKPQPPAQESDLKLFIDSVCINPLVEAGTLTDTNSQTGVSARDGSFTRDKQAGFKDKVIIKFTLVAPIAAPPAVAGQIDPVTFQTTVQLR